ncbi:capsular polysaccharide export protein [Bordetella pertussis]|nr:capsular polysaccharide export protein [Bordetella pertussis]
MVTYGKPFYAGWGLTEDRAADWPRDRRTRRLSLDELVAGTLLRYPLYWDWELRGYTTCEAVLTHIFETRERLQREGRLPRAARRLCAPPGAQAADIVAGPMSRSMA